MIPNKAKLAKLSIVFALLMVLLVPTVASANGGTIIFTSDVGPFNIIVTRSPTPPTPNVSMHLNVLITKVGSPQKVTDATVIFTPTMPGMDMPGSAPLRAYKGQTENTYDVDIPVTMEGIWEIKVTVISPQFGQGDFTLKDKVEKPDAPWPIIIAILIGLPVLAGLTWFLLFRKSGLDEDEDDDEPEKPSKPAGPPVEQKKSS